MLFCALAFNITFFLQELFLVIPKALTPGLHPTLFHNNHAWTGNNPVAGLLQGTGALTDLASGLFFAWLLARPPTPSVTLRLFLFWMTYQGLFLALPQFVIGAFIPANDVGMAMTYLRLSVATKLAAAFVALLMMLIAGIWLARRFVGLIGTSGETFSGAARAAFVLRSATLPALASVILLVPFREPRNLVEVILLPLIVVISGMLWVQSGAALAPPAARADRASPSVAIPFGVLLALLAAFQLVLRPGVHFR